MTIKNNRAIGSRQKEERKGNKMEETQEVENPEVETHPTSEKIEKAKDKEAKAAKSEYKKALKKVEGIREMTLSPGWQALHAIIAGLQYENHEALVRCKPSMMFFHQAMVQFPETLQSAVGKIEIEALNRLSPMDGELPLWGESCATASYNHEDGKVEIEYPGQED